MIATEKFEVKEFRLDVIEASRVQPVLVDFWADWCAPCKYIGPILEKLATEPGVLWKLVKIDTEKYPEIASEWGIRGIPNLKLFYKGKVIDEVAGAMAEPDLRTWLDARMPSEAKTLQYEGLELIENGALNEGIACLEKAIAADSSLEQAKITLAKHKLWQSPAEAMALLDGISYLDQAAELLLLAEVLTLNESEFAASRAGRALQQGIGALRDVNFDEAIYHFIEAIMADKRFKDELARRLTIAIFHYLGESHPITRQYRRKFDMALY